MTVFLEVMQHADEMQHEWESNTVLQHDADDAESGAAERVRVLGAGRLLVDGPEANQHVELVGESDGDRHRLARHLIRWA